MPTKTAVIEQALENHLEAILLPKYILERAIEIIETHPLLKHRNPRDGIDALQVMILALIKNFPNEGFEKYRKGTPEWEDLVAMLEKRWHLV